MSYIHIPHDRPLEYRTAFQILQTHAKQQPNKEAIVFRDEKLNRVSLTFQEFDTMSSSLAAGLLEIGVGRGDRVLVLLPSYVEFVLFHLALNRIGAVMIAIEEDSYPAVFGIPDLACVITRVGPSVVNNDKVISETKKALYQNMLKAAVLVGSDADADLQDHPKAYTYQKLFLMAKENPESAANVRKTEAKVQMDDPCLVIFSSGSTSLPKPIEYTHHAYVNGVYASIRGLQLNKDCILFFDTPFDWITGISFCIGSCVVQGLTYIEFPPKSGLDAKHLVTILSIIAEERVTVASFPLYRLQDMAINKERIKSMRHDIKLQHITVGGQPTPLSLLEDVFEIWPKIKVINAYGSTESNVCLSQEIDKDNLDSLDYGVMNVVPGMEVKIVNENGQLLPLGETGEICLRSAWVSFCNWDYMDPDLEGRVDTSRKSNGWHSSKDVGIVVNQNCIRLLGRLDFMMKVAGDSIPPSLVESTLQEHPDVKKVCVVGVPDERLYQKICACIILKQDHRDNRNDLNEKFDQWGKDKFWESSSGFMIKPHYYVFLDSFPATRTGKVNLREVRKIAIKELGLMQ
ncbi:acyl-CoA synthetase family member 2, mitochondrial [Exaiptasia diaphana]|uniref:Uncharacterized protein n=1 Tax=Exaiptasia diaphana TaxID=2652724 RepID=A0A913X988_EXADI|nr:acyl-CoA synthetase family member 2, mitochondrial [Exaiptasia diaphana]KXJ28504.1 Acyl-CoA synthetase family member 2, mitochondrial [Exaiptasia diaphana]